MKQLKGHLYLVPLPIATTSELSEHDGEYRIRRFVSALLGLQEVPEKWLKVCAVDPDYLGENGQIPEGKSDDWNRNGYFVDGVPGTLPFPESLPANLFTGKKENDEVSFSYGDMQVTVVCREVPYKFGEYGSFEAVFDRIMSEETCEEEEEEESMGEEEEEPMGKIRKETGAEKDASPTLYDTNEELPTAAKVALGILGGLALLGLGVAIGVNGSNGD